MMPPQSTVVLEITLPGAQEPVAPPLLDELLDELELLEELEDELLDEELLLEELEELDDELDEELEPPLLLIGMEHSLVPPETLLPAPKVTSPQTKLPVSVLRVNLSARP